MRITVTQVRGFYKVMTSTIGNRRVRFCGSTAYVRISPLCNLPLLILIWLAGSGKTVLWYVSPVILFLGVLTYFSSSIVEDIQATCQTGLAKLVFFYFDSHNIGKQDARNLLSSLLLQFCHESDHFCQILSSLYSIHGDGSLLPSSVALMEYLKKFLKLPRHSEIYIVVDALDECPNVSGLPTPREQVLTIIKELIGLRLPNVHFCITSRLGVDIPEVRRKGLLVSYEVFCKGLAAVVLHEVVLHEQAGQYQDIFDYIDYVVSSDPQMRRWREEDRRLVVKTLTEKGGAM